MAINNKEFKDLAVKSLMQPPSQRKDGIRKQQCSATVALHAATLDPFAPHIQLVLPPKEIVY